MDFHTFQITIPCLPILFHDFHCRSHLTEQIKSIGLPTRRFHSADEGNEILSVVNVRYHIFPQLTYLN